MMLTHCGNNVRNRYSGCVFSVKDIVPVPLKTSRNQKCEIRVNSFANRSVIAFAHYLIETNVPGGAVPPLTTLLRVDRALRAR